MIAIQEMSRSLGRRTSGLIVGAVILADLTAQILPGDHTY
jgi:hypothetical protein